MSLCNRISKNKFESRDKLFFSYVFFPIKSARVRSKSEALDLGVKCKETSKSSAVRIKKIALKYYLF